MSALICMIIAFSSLKVHITTTMAPLHPTAPSRARTTLVIVLACVYSILALYDVYLSLHDSYPRMNAEGLANLLFLIGVIPWGKTAPAAVPNAPQRRHWRHVIQLDCLLICVGLISYAVYYRLMPH